MLLDNFREIFMELYCKAALCYISFPYILAYLDCELPWIGIAGYNVWLCLYILQYSCFEHFQ